MFPKATTPRRNDCGAQHGSSATVYGSSITENTVHGSRATPPPTAGRQVEDVPGNDWATTKKLNLIAFSAEIRRSGSTTSIASMSALKRCPNLRPHGHGLGSRVSFPTSTTDFTLSEQVVKVR